MTEDIRKAIEEEQREAEKERYLEVLDERELLTKSVVEGLVSYAKLATQLSYGETVDTSDEIFKDWSEAAVDRLKTVEGLADIIKIDELDKLKGNPELMVTNLVSSVVEFLCHMASEDFVMDVVLAYVKPDTASRAFKKVGMSSGQYIRPGVEIRRINLSEVPDLRELFGEILKDLRRRHEEMEDLDDDED